MEKVTRSFTILCPIDWNFVDKPAHLLFGVPFFEKIGKEKLGADIRVKYLKYHQVKNILFITLCLNFYLSIKILFCHHDIVYYGTDPKNIFLLSFLKTIKLYNKPIYAWKYTAINGTNNSISNFIKKISYKGFNKIFMMTDKHIRESIQHNICILNQLSFMEWGADIHYIQKFKQKKYSTFTFISCGKAYRDFETMCHAFSEVKNAELHIICPKKWGGIDYQKILKPLISPSIKVLFVEDINLLESNKPKLLDFIYDEMQKCHCSLSICQDVNFGVGYTQILDSMACSLPIIATWNEDNPIDIDSAEIGKTIPPKDVAELRSIMTYLVNNPNVANSMGTRSFELAQNKYSIEIVAENILKEIINVS